VRIILARHGNTFESSSDAVWVGSTTDLALTDKGREQANLLGRAIKKATITPAAVYTSPLKRASEYANLAIASGGLPLSAKVDSRLHEIDYGEWEGLNDQEIIERFGQEQLFAWREHSTWVDKWSTEESEFREQTAEFVRDLKEQYQNSDYILCISSNGRLRYFLDEIAGAWDNLQASHGLAMKTGNISLIELDKAGGKVIFWNQGPDSLVDRILLD